jgi:hypothetical protein
LSFGSQLVPFIETIPAYRSPKNENRSIHRRHHARTGLCGPR